MTSMGFFHTNFYLTFQSFGRKEKNSPWRPKRKTSVCISKLAIRYSRHKYKGWEMEEGGEGG